MGMSEYMENPALGGRLIRAARRTSNSKMLCIPHIPRALAVSRAQCRSGPGTEVSETAGPALTTSAVGLRVPLPLHLATNCFLQAGSQQILSSSCVQGLAAGAGRSAEQDRVLALRDSLF